MNTMRSDHQYTQEYLWGKEQEKNVKVPLSIAYTAQQINILC